eukprot:CAMPEP_0176143888 /NCGR_PEP_ID=MMETSP0120_2-20121206/73243_1 /TAXON_ID=160619 /ORGANISM="Kryptoperidinium foliaceum, Strain CCMP 1326" /LENGTH=369 /DNA_ID=CAMNT_0017480219 /DNA_START=29 /DNA_END=1134 /DNA_ORIENTATION=+
MASRSDTESPQTSVRTGSKAVPGAIAPDAEFELAASAAGADGPFELSAAVAFARSIFAADMEQLLLEERAARCAETSALRERIAVSELQLATFKARVAKQVGELRQDTARRLAALECRLATFMAQPSQAVAAPGVSGASASSLPASVNDAGESAQDMAPHETTSSWASGAGQSPSAVCDVVDSAVELPADFVVCRRGSFSDGAGSLSQAAARFFGGLGAAGSVGVGVEARSPYSSAIIVQQPGESRDVADGADGDMAPEFSASSARIRAFAPGGDGELRGAEMTDSLHDRPAAVAGSPEEREASDKGLRVRAASWPWTPLSARSPGRASATTPGSGAGDAHAAATGHHIARRIVFGHADVAAIGHPAGG